MSQDQQTTTVRPFATYDFNGQIVQQFDFVTDEQLQNQLEKGNQSYLKYKNYSIEQKQDLLLKLADILDKNLQEDAKLITQEMGKPINEAIGEISKSRDHCRYYANKLEELSKPSVFQSYNAKQQIVHEPIGLIYVITPFNFPHWQIFKPVIANIALGNTVIVRTSDSTPLVGLNILQRFQEAGFGDIYQNTFSKPGQLEQIVSNQFIKGVSFTGSTGAGRYISSITAKYLKKQVMELGGSDPFIVLPDADVNFASNLALKARLFNCGQVCISSKRILVNENIYDEFVSQILEKIKNYKIGDPFSKETQIGPMARKDLLNGILNQIEKAQKQGGCKLLYGGEKINSLQGNYITPAVFEVTSNSNILLQEEVFGPVLIIKKVKNPEEAIEIANSSEYGLGSVLVGKDTKLAQQYASQIESGMVFINEMCKTVSEYPVGGTKQSGFGRECGEYGYKEFSNIKLIWTQEQ